MKIDEVSKPSSFGFSKAECIKNKDLDSKFPIAPISASKIEPIGGEIEELCDDKLSDISEAWEKEILNPKKIVLSVTLFDYLIMERK